MQTSDLPNEGSGYVFVLNGGAIDWKSAKESTIAMYSIKAKYIIATKASIEAVSMRKFIDELGDIMPSNKRPMEMLCYAMLNELGASLIFNSLNKDYDQFVQNYNMHNIGKTIAELHAMLKLYEKGIQKKAETLVVLAIREGKIQKDKKNREGKKGKDKGNNKLTYDPKPKILWLRKRDNPIKESICHDCKEVGH
nr:hypothetical protein [Tanacetum cinerariifolium]